MAKNSVRDYSATNSSNTDIQSIDISEGCSPAGINNALREVMVDLKNVSTGAVALETPSADQLNVDNLRLDGNTISSTDTNGDITIDPDGTGDTIVASGNVGIGTASPNEKVTSSNGFLSIGAVSTTARDGAIVDYSGSISRFVAGRAGGNYGQWEAHVAGASGITKRYQIDYDSTFHWFAADGTTERMRVDTVGNLLVGTTTQNGTDGITLRGGGTDPEVMLNKTYSGNVNGVRCQHNSTYVGGITYNNTSTAFNTSSDARLKENITYDWDATTRLKQLKPARFNFIIDPDTTVDGFLAHEAQAVVPESVTGTHNEVDDDGNPVYQGIDQSKIVPLLCKTILELEARITALEAE